MAIIPCHMTRYFFDSFDGSERVRDEEGTEHVNLVSAQKEASRALSEMLREKVPATGRIEIQVDVRDASGAIVAQAKALIEIS